MLALRLASIIFWTLLSRGISLPIPANCNKLTGKRCGGALQNSNTHSSSNYGASSGSQSNSRPLVQIPTPESFSNFSNQHPSWESKACHNFWGATPDNGEPILTRELFSTSPLLENPTDQNVANLLNTRVSWPPKDRGSALELLDAAKSRFSTQTNFVPRLATVVNAKIDHVRRTVYIKNLKAGSSTVDVVFTKMVGLDKHSSLILDEGFNETSTLRHCTKDSSPLNCRPHWLRVNDIPDEIIENYFFFSFVRDPFPRVVSAHHEVRTDSFTNIVKGKRKMAQNPHYSGQLHQLTRAGFSGKMIRMDFVGKLDDMDNEWARLLPALDPKVARLSPRERRELVLSPGGVISSKHVGQHRSSAAVLGNTSHTLLPFSETEHFTQLHVILVCRRYVQDLVCFDMEVPRVCIDHVDLVLDLQTPRRFI